MQIVEHEDFDFEFVTIVYKNGETKVVRVPAEEIDDEKAIIKRLFKDRSPEKVSVTISTLIQEL